MKTLTTPTRLDHPRPPDPRISEPVVSAALLAQIHEVGALIGQLECRRNGLLRQWERLYQQRRHTRVQREEVAA